MKLINNTVCRELSVGLGWRLRSQGIGNTLLTSVSKFTIEWEFV